VVHALKQQRAQHVLETMAWLQHAVGAAHGRLPHPAHTCGAQLLQLLQLRQPLPLKLLHRADVQRRQRRQCTPQLAREPHMLQVRQAQALQVAHAQGQHGLRAGCLLLLLLRLQ
jgi:hypothetical protein